MSAARVQASAAAVSAGAGAGVLAGQDAAAGLGTGRIFHHYRALCLALVAAVGPLLRHLDLAENSLDRLGTGRLDHVTAPQETTHFHLKPSGWTHIRQARPDPLPSAYTGGGTGREGLQYRGREGYNIGVQF